jgi:hypothetical protein
VSVDLGEVVLVHVRVSVLLAVVAVAVLVLDMLMMVAGMRVAVALAAVVVFVDVRLVMGVLIGHSRFPSLLLAGQADSLFTRCTPESSRWWPGTPGPACSALNTASSTNWRT